MMKKKQFLMVSLVLSLSITACVSDSDGSTPTIDGDAVAFCHSVGGKVKTLKEDKQQFCLLPEGDVVELNRFYQDNKK